jgi:hypothetical protein
MYSCSYDWIDSILVAMMWWRDICFIPRSNESIKVLRGGDSEEALALLSASLRQELEGLVERNLLRVGDVV